jgi:CRP/FNR family transcriptional regulator, cyclic AMP receptor protein
LGERFIIDTNFVMSASDTLNHQHRRILEAARKVPVLSMVFGRLNPHQQEILSLLRTTPIFSDLSPAELVDLLHLLHERTFVAGETIFTEGEPGLGLYVVFKGEVEISRKGKTQSQLARLGPAEIFGEVSFLDGRGRSATATAHTRSELIGFYRTELFDLLKRKPRLASKILLSLGRQITLRMRALLDTAGL